MVGNDSDKSRMRGKGGEVPEAKQRHEVTHPRPSTSETSMRLPGPSSARHRLSAHPWRSTSSCAHVQGYSVALVCTNKTT